MPTTMRAFVETLQNMQWFGRGGVPLLRDPRLLPVVRGTSTSDHANPCKFKEKEKMKSTINMKTIEPFTSVSKNTNVLLFSQLLQVKHLTQIWRRVKLKVMRDAAQRKDWWANPTALETPVHILRTAPGAATLTHQWPDEGDIRLRDMLKYPGVVIFFWEDFITSLFQLELLRQSALLLSSGEGVSKVFLVESSVVGGLFFFFEEGGSRLLRVLMIKKKRAKRSVRQSAVSQSSCSSSLTELQLSLRVLRASHHSGKTNHRHLSPFTQVIRPKWVSLSFQSSWDSWRTGIFPELPLFFSFFFFRGKLSNGECERWRWEFTSTRCCQIEAITRV